MGWPPWRIEQVLDNPVYCGRLALNPR
jgi:hypothetical protein